MPTPPDSLALDLPQQPVEYPSWLLTEKDVDDLGELLGESRPHFSRHNNPHDS